MRCGIVGVMESEGMTTRELPQFLKQGDPELGAPRARYPGM